jgi:hypothetical protein
VPQILTFYMTADSKLLPKAHTYLPPKIPFTHEHDYVNAGLAEMQFLLQTCGRYFNCRKKFLINRLSQKFSALVELPISAAI